MQAKYFVLDQNVLRKPDLARLIARDPASKFVLPDLSFLEMTKSADWEDTLRNSLGQLAVIPRRVVVAHSVNDALGREVSSLVPVNRHMLSLEATEFVRDILAWARTGESNSAIQRIRDDPDDHRQALARDHLSHDENKRSLQTLIEATRRFIPEGLQRQMRGQSLSAEDRLDIVHNIARGLVPEVLATRGVSLNKSRAFLSRKPLLYRYLVVRVWYCADWISKGGLEPYPEEKVTNEVMDHQYVLTASFFHGLESLDGKAKRAYDALRSILQRKV